jgi:DNA-directed RNA polymerase beta subunit/intein/homing endonuclease
MEEFTQDDILELQDLFFKETYALYQLQYNHFHQFLEESIPRELKENNNIFHEGIVGDKIYRYRFLFDNISIKPPTLPNQDEYMFPEDARKKNLTYSSKLEATVTQIQEIIDINTDEKEVRIIGDVEKEIPIAYLPIMVKSNYCTTHIRKDIKNTECKYDPGCYFIVKGNEKVVIGMERMVQNKLLVFKKKDSTYKDKHMIFATINSKREDYTDMIQTLNVKMKKDNTIIVDSPHFNDVPLFIMLRGLGLVSDKDIIDYITNDPNDTDMINILRISLNEILPEKGKAITDVNKPIKEQTAAIDYMVTKLKRYKRYTEVDEDKKELQKRNHILYILNNDILPHTGGNLLHKAHFICLMVHKMLNVYLKRKEVDDRDSYVNKRVDMPGILLTQLFKQYYKKLLNDIKKFFQKKYSGDDSNPINVINQIKPNTIEQGMINGLATGVWGTHKARKGVSQALQRYSYLQTVSYFRRIVTPSIDSSTQKVTSIRHVRSNQYGYLCLTKDSEILLSDGYTVEKISNFTEKHKVITIDDSNLDEEPSKISNLFGKMSDKLMKITTISGRCIKCTPDHPLLVRNNNKYIWKKASELTQIDELIIKHTNKYIDVNNNTRFNISSDNIDKQYKIELLKLNLLDRNFSQYETEILARLIGANITDGNIHLRNNNRYYDASFNVGEQEDAFKLVDDIMYFGFESPSITRCITHFQSLDLPRQACGKEKTTYKTYKVQKNGCFAYFMKLIGAFVGKKTNMKRVIPDWIKNSNLRTKREFLSGFQGGDGSKVSVHSNVDKYKIQLGPTHQFTNNEYLQDTVNYLTSVSDIFSELGINSNITTKTIDDTQTCVSLFISNTLDNLANYIDIIGYRYCNEKQRNSAIVIEYIKYKKCFCDKKKNTYNRILLLSDNNKSITEINKITSVSRAHIRRIINANKNNKIINPRCDNILSFVDFITKYNLTSDKVANPIDSIEYIEPEMVYDFMTLSKNHSFIANSIVTHNCVVETPEGAKVGLQKHLSLMADITLDMSSQEYIISELLKENGKIINIEDIHPYEFNKYFMVFLNGKWLGFIEDGLEMSEYLKQKRTSNYINNYVSIVFNIINKEIRIYTDKGRFIRPLLKVHDNQLKLTKNMLNNIDLKGEDINKILRWNQFLLKYKNVIDYVDIEESEFAMIAMYVEDLHINKQRMLKTIPNPNSVGDEINRYNDTVYVKYDYCEFHPSMMLGSTSACIPFCEHNQAPRNIYNFSQAKQGKGIFATNERHRMDISYRLANPSVPLVQTRGMKYLKSNELPNGENVIVAIACYTGYNQEDSIVINKSALDRGLFRSYVLKKYTDEIKKNPSTSQDDKFMKPDPNRVSGMKKVNYDKLNSKGYVEVETKIDNGDVIIGKVSPIQPGVENNAKIYKDSSQVYKSGVSGVIDKVYTGIFNNDDYEMYAVQVRSERKPQIGDKYACYSKDHEVLTDKGWLTFDNLTYDHKVATLVDGETLEYQKPTEIMSYDYKGKLYNVKSNQVHLTVTPNHRMYVGNRRKTNFKIEKAEDIFGKTKTYKKNVVYGLRNNDCEFILPGCYDLPNLNLDMDAWLEFFGIWFAEGCTIRDWGITFATHKQRVKDKLKDICEILEFEIRKHKDKKDDDIRNAWCFNDKRLVNYFKPLSVGAVNKSLPDWCFTLNIEQTRLLINGMMLGDGHTMKNGTRRYDTSSTQLADDFQRLCLHAGWSCNIAIKYKAGHESYCAPRDEIFKSTADAYRMTIITCQNTPIVNKNVNAGKQQDSWIDYDDKVNCCSVKSGIIYVRNNISKTVIWSGNSRHGQKGTCGVILSNADMPFTKEGIQPDIIINPNAIPSRMTVGQLLECVLGKVSSLGGYYSDATPFNKYNIQEAMDILKQHGFQEHGFEELYCGMTGKKIRSKIFIGPTFYMRLKHLVQDKIHARARGPRQILTRQPPEGRSRDGGLRFGEMERDCWTMNVLITLTNGLSMKIKNMENNKIGVLGFDENKNGLVKSKQIDFMNKGTRPCVELTMEDGRKTTCTEDHPLLTENNEWIKAKDLVINKDRLKVGITCPELDIEKEIAECDGWELKLHDLTLKTDNKENLLKTQAFARIIGLLITDGHITKDNEGRVYLGHKLDVEQFLIDLNMFCNKETYSIEKHCYTIILPQVFMQNILKLNGLTIGRKINQEAILPEFVNTCPKSILREFLGGMFGGDGHTCFLGLHRGKRDILSSVGFSKSKTKDNVESLNAMMEQIKVLLSKFDINEVTIQKPKEISDSKSKVNNIKVYEIVLHIALDNLIKFSETIGFRYCCHKLQRLEGGVSYKRLRTEVIRQHNWIVNRVDEITNYKALKLENPSKNIRTKNAIIEAVKELKQNEALIHEYAIPTTHDISDHLIKGTSFGSFRSNSFPTAEDFLKKINILDWFLDDDETTYGVERQNDFLPTMNMKVIGRKSVGDRPVYDISVDKTHSFLANGVVAHNCMIAHGMGQFLKERLVDTSDQYNVHICSSCGMFARKKPDKNIYLCQLCNMKGESYTTHKIELPYAFKLLIQELQAINILPKIKVKTDIYNEEPSLHQ